MSRHWVIGARPFETTKIFCNLVNKWKWQFIVQSRIKKSYNINVKHMKIRLRSGHKIPPKINAVKWFISQPTNAQLCITTFTSLYNIYSYMFRHSCHHQGVLHLCLAKLHKFLKLKQLKLKFHTIIKIQRDSKRWTQFRKSIFPN